MKKEKLCILGLGNPGRKYVSTRHNIGFQIVDCFVENTFPKKSFRFRKKLFAELTKIDFEEKKIFVAKPQTFMNKSGEASKAITQYYGIPTENLIVVHDDVDLPFGLVRFSNSSGPGGHKGVRSIIDQYGSKDFVRLRFGIGKEAKKKETEKFVLKKFSKSEQSELPDLMSFCSDAIAFLIHNGFEKTANLYNEKKTSHC